MQGPKDCASLLFNFFCLETQKGKNKPRFRKMTTYVLIKLILVLTVLINNHKISRKLLAKIQTCFQNKKTDEKESMLS